MLPTEVTGVGIAPTVHTVSIDTTIGGPTDGNLTSESLATAPTAPFLEPASTAIPSLAELSGVSNGDVDWLVRVKSKKLQKLPKEDSKRRMSSVDPAKIPAEVLAHPPTTPILSKDQSLKGKVGPVPTGSPTAMAGPVIHSPSAPPGLAPMATPSVRPRSISSPEPKAVPLSLSATGLNSASASGVGSAPGPTPGSAASSLSRSLSGKRSFLSGIASKFKSQTEPTPALSASPPSTGLLRRKSKVSSSANSVLGTTSSDITKSFNQFFDVGIHPAPKERGAGTGKPVAAPRPPVQTQASPEPARSHPLVLSGQRVVLNKNPNKLPPLPLDEIKNLNLRRVTFNLNTLPSDPQQQIPSRNPRKGNVAIPLDFLEPPSRLNAGIVGREQATERAAGLSAEQKHDLLVAQVTHAESLQESERHARDAHVAARKLADEVRKLSLKGAFGTSASVGLVGEEAEASTPLVDGPIHLHHHHFGSEVSSTSDLEPSLDTIYTRCCHLREILPIPATLKQLKNKERPLQVLKLLNPRPTLIDVLSFSDFIAITPIHTIIFDNVTMTTEMLQIFLLSLVRSVHLEKLSMRNVAIDSEGWKVVCKFLSRNASVTKLDISQQKMKADTPTSHNRASMNWNLFINALILRGGLAELVINGCRMTDEQFRLLVHHGVSLCTRRFGVAQTELSVAKAQILCDLLHDGEAKCHGLDIAFNDLSQGQLQPFITSLGPATQLYFFSLNSTNITNVTEMTLLLEALAKVPTLRFLDLSSLPGLFPGILPALRKNLPLFADLRRIHFDLNQLNDVSIKIISEILPLCRTLINVSFIGNRDLSYSSVAALYTAVKLSSSIYTLEIDTDLVPDDLSTRIAFYLMKNMEKSVNREATDLHLPFTGDEELIFDGSLLAQSAERLLEYKPSEQAGDDEETQRIITKALVERTRHVRGEIHKCIDDLFHKRTAGLLEMEAKETLLRFCLLDSSLEKITAMFDEDSAPLVEGAPPIVVELDHLHENSSEVIQSGPIVSPRMIPEAHQTSYFSGGSYFAGIPPTTAKGSALLVPDNQPHQVVLELNVPIDGATGMPVLIRSISLQSVQARRQEEEEGELHRFGFFVQSQELEGAEEKPEVAPFLPLGGVPSGSELREAIIKAKGIDSVADLIHNIQTNRVKLDTIYAVETNDDAESINSEVEGEPIGEGAKDHGQKEYEAVVDETYNKLLQAVEKVRSRPEA